MGEPLPEQALDTAVDPAEIVQQSFATERRGFDQRQVQQYLRAVADSLGDAQKREADMRTRLGRAVRRAETAEKALRETPEGQAAELNRELADQVESVLEAARVTGEQRTAAAEKSAEQMLAKAKADAAEMRAEAEALLQQRRDEADLAATELVGEGQAEAQALRDQAKTDAHRRLGEAADRVERVRDECDVLIREAEEARAQILEDMERRRRQARAQVERLRVGRDRLLRSYEVVRRTLEETTVELKSSLNEAKVRGDGAARAIAAEPLASREQLEAELRDAKMIGRITISDPAPAPAAPQSDKTTAPRSPALPRLLDSSPAAASDSTAASASGGPRVTEAMKKGATGKTAKYPKAPAVAPTLSASTHTDAPQDPIAVMMAAAEAKEAAAAAAASAAVEAELGPIDPELAGLADDDLDVVEPCDEIEEVLAVPVEGDVEQSPAAPGLFAALRAQRPGKKKAAAAKKAATKPTSVKKANAATAKTATKAPAKTSAKPAASSTKTPKTTLAANAAAPEPKTAPVVATAKTAKTSSGKAPKVATAAAKAPVTKAPVTKAAASKSAVSKTAVSKTAAATTSPAPKAAGPRSEAPAHLIPGIEAQRDAVIADAAKQLERRLKRALADEQNELLAGIRAAKKNVALTAIVGDIDTHLNRYVVAIHEVAAVTYGAGAALIDAEATQGTLPAGAVEELLESAVISPIRQRLELLDDLKVDAADLHLDPVRAFYRQRKIEHLGDAASRLANLLCVAGVCDALPQESALPWTVAAK